MRAAGSPDSLPRFQYEVDMRRALLTGTALTRYNLFDNLTPQYNDNGDPSPFTYGTRFFSDVAGRVVAIRFYKGLNNGGGNSHTVALYSASGTLLASAATASEPASGWVTTNLSTPISITANTAYTAAVFFPVGHAVYSDAFFTSQYNSPPLHAYANGNGGNGVYNLADTLQRPTNFYNEGYFIDAVVEVG